MSEVAAVLHGTCVEHMDAHKEMYGVTESYNKIISGRAQQAVFLIYIYTQNNNVLYINCRVVAQDFMSS